MEAYLVNRCYTAGFDSTETVIGPERAIPVQVDLMNKTEAFLEDTKSLLAYLEETEEWRRNKVMQVIEQFIRDAFDSLEITLSHFNGTRWLHAISTQCCM